MRGNDHGVEAVPRAARLLPMAVLALTGCVGEPQLRGELASMTRLLDRAEEDGAVACAPLAMASARAHVAFAHAALDDGRGHEAAEHVRVAKPNVGAATRLTADCRETTGPVQVEAADDQDGDGLFDQDDACPDEPGPATGDGCPQRAVEPAAPSDSDGDGVHDQHDGCPERAEDRDGHDDSDGCPDDDNDGDGVADASDGCPDEAGPGDNRGCPRVYDFVHVTERAVRLDQDVLFRSGRADLKAASFPLLNTVAQVLADHPGMRIEVQGHTDNRGSDDHNLQLSEQRAQAVRDYLVRQGVAADRLGARGFGETRPIESNQTAAGRATNRRVELIRTDGGDRSQTTGVEGRR